MLVPLVILIVILKVLRYPDYSSFGPITSSAEGDTDFSSDNQGTATPPLLMFCLLGVLSAFACRQKIFPPRSFGDERC